MQTNGRAGSSTKHVDLVPVRGSAGAVEPGSGPPGQRVDGIGYVLDADARQDRRHRPRRLPNPVTGEIRPTAREIIRDLASYTEVSPSGTGVKVFFRADPMPRLERHKIVISKATDGGKDEAIEAYTEGRYFTLTGQHLDGTPDEITDATEAFERLAARLAQASRKDKARTTTAPVEKAPAADLPPVDEALPAKLRAFLENDPKLHRAWATGSKLGTGGDTLGQRA